MSALVTGFAPMSKRLEGERSERLEQASRRMYYHHSFLDDVTRGIGPHDLIILSAPTGLGKTQLALSIAMENAKLGKRVHYFALEAEPRELERRAKYAEISRLAHAAQHPEASTLSYQDWFFGDCEGVAEQYDALADDAVAHGFPSLSTFYRGARFTAADLAREVARIHERTDMIVVDHLHYIDEDVETSEAKALGDTVKAIRDVALLIGKPIILVAHLRKRERGKMRRLIADYEDIHGSSNVVKICTQIIILERAEDIEAPRWWLSPTYVVLEKDRRGGRCRFVAVQNFDLRLKSYASRYTLGLVKSNKWEELPPGDVPRWARSHIPMAPQQTLPGADHPNAPGAS